MNSNLSDIVHDFLTTGFWLANRYGMLMILWAHPSAAIPFAISVSWFSEGFDICGRIMGFIDTVVSPHCSFNASKDLSVVRAEAWRTIYE